ncbi:MAG TPA: ankyrin repeat domain-containing protein, partial [bacterium]
MKTIKSILAVIGILFLTVTSEAQEIFDAVKANDLAKVKAFIEKDISLINVKDNNGNTPLHSAAIIGSVPITEFLISMGADMNSQEDRGYTSLHYACHYNVENIAVFLIEKG